MIKMKLMLKRIAGLAISASLVVGLCPLSAFAISACGPADYSETPTVRATYELIDDKDGDGKISAGDTFWMIVKVHDLSTIGTGQAFLQYDSTVIQPTLANGTTQQKPNNVNMFAGLAEKSSTIVATSIYEPNYTTTFDNTAWYGTEVADFRAPRASDKVDLSNPNMWVIGYNFGIGAGIEQAGLTNWTLTEEQKKNGIQLYKMRYTAITNDDPLVSFLPLGTFVQLDSVAEGGAFKEQSKGTMNLYVEPILGAAAGEESSTTLSAITVSDIAAPAAGGIVPTSTAVTFGVAEGGTVPTEAAASIAWEKGGTAYNETTFQDYGTEYKATYTVAIPEGYLYAEGTTAVTLGGADAGVVTDNTTAITFTKTYTTAVDPDAALVTAAKSAVEGGTYTASQAEIADAAAAKAALQTKISALSLNGVTAAVNDGTYKAAVAGTAGQPAGTNGSYTATVGLSKGAASATTAEITLTIQATPYVAPGVTTAPTFTSDTYTLTSGTDSAATFPVGNSSSYGAAVTVTVYTDAQASVPASGVTGSYSGGTLNLNGVAAGEYYVTFTEAGKTVSSAVKVTVKAYVAPVQPVEPPKPAEPGAESGMTKEDPSIVTGQTSYEFTYKSTEAGTPVIGKVTLKKKAGGVFDLNAVADADIVYQMTAAPASGYKFTGWVKTATGFSLFALDENGIDLTAPTIEGTADVLSQYTAVFAEQGSVAAGDPKLDQMTVSTTDGKSILLGTDHNKDGFRSDVTDYLLYLLPEATGFDLSMAIETKEEDVFDHVVKVSGAALTAAATTSGGIVTHSYTTTVPVTDGTVTIEVTAGGKTTAYTVKAARVSALPLILMEAEDKGSGVYRLNVNLENTIANEFAFKLKLDNSVFTGFSANAAELSDGDVTATLAAMTVSGGAFEVAYAAYDATTNELEVVMATADSSYSDCTAKTPVIRLEFLTSSGGSVAADDWSKLTIDSDLSKSTLTDQRFLAFAETTTAADAGLIQIRMPDMMTIVGYLNSLMKADVQASQAAIHIKSGSDLMKTVSPESTRRFTAQVSEGTYDLEIVLPNYVTLKAAIGPDNAIIGALALTAGDLTGDGQVTVEDRAALLNLLYTTVTAGALGDVDGDGKVTGADLGYLLANIK